MYNINVHANKNVFTNDSYLIGLYKNEVFVFGLFSPNWFVDRGMAWQFLKMHYLFTVGVR